MKDKNETAEKRKMTGKERDFQRDVLKKYRDDGTFPSITIMANKSETSFSLVSMFVRGNSQNQEMRDYIMTRAKKNFDVVPADLQQLFDIWEETS